MAQGIMGKIYYIYAIIDGNSKFRDIDKYMRETWCECCEHLSLFYKKRTTIIKKSELISEYKKGDKFRYEYDMCSTTIIYFEIIEKLEGEKNKKIINIIRNEEPKIKCVKCKKKSEYIDRMGESYCNTCSKKVETELNKITNSPRTGICGYE
jgi:hypothetical protein